MDTITKRKKQKQEFLKDLRYHLASYNLLEPEVIIKCKKKALEEIRKDNPGLVLWTNSSKLDQGQIVAAACQEEKPTAKWKEKNLFLGKNKEILDTE